jgi:hypothetical protein
MTADSLTRAALCCISASCPMAWLDEMDRRDRHLAP